MKKYYYGCSRHKVEHKLGDSRSAIPVMENNLLFFCIDAEDLRKTLEGSGELVFQGKSWDAKSTRDLIDNNGLVFEEYYFKSRKEAEQMFSVPTYREY